MATETVSTSAGSRHRRDARGRRIRGAAEAEFKPRTERAATEVENAVSDAGRSRRSPTRSLDQGRRRRHDRGDDRAARPEAVGADQRDPARAGVPEARERLARPALPRQQHRDRRDAEDPRHEHLEEGARPQPAQLYPGRRAGTRARSSRRSTRQEFGQFGGEPFGCLVGDYYFNHLPPDVELLRDIARSPAAAHAPFIAGADPTLMEMDSWQELANPRDLSKIFDTPEYAAWQSLRDSDDARYVGLACRASWRACPTAPRPSRSRSSTSRRTPTATRREVRLDERGLRDGGQHQPRVQGLRLVLAHPRRRVGRRGRRTCRPTPSRPTTAAST